MNPIYITNNWNNDMLKVHKFGIMQRKWYQWFMLMTLDRSLCSGNMQAKIHSNQQANIELVRPAPDKYDAEYI